MMLLKQAILNDRQQAQTELQQANLTLEQHVADRTKELLILNEQLRIAEGVETQAQLQHVEALGFIA